MPTGTVKWFNNAKGFGFILPDAGGEDLFAHYSSIEMEGYRTLKAGQPVTFEIEKGDKGLHAKSIQIVKSGSSSNPTPAKDSVHEKAESDLSLAEETS